MFALWPGGGWPLKYSWCKCIILPKGGSLSHATEGTSAVCDVSCVCIYVGVFPAGGVSVSASDWSWDPEAPVLLKADL